MSDAVGPVRPCPSATSPGRSRKPPRRVLLIMAGVAGLLILGLVAATGIVFARRYSDYGAFFPGRTPEKLTYCSGRHYLRGEPVTRAAAEPAGGSLVAVGRTPGGATLFGPKSLAVVASQAVCPTVLWVADVGKARLMTYILSGGP